MIGSRSSWLYKGGEGGGTENPPQSAPEVSEMHHSVPSSPISSPQSAVELAVVVHHPVEGGFDHGLKRPVHDIQDRHTFIVVWNQRSEIRGNTNPMLYALA